MDNEDPLERSVHLLEEALNSPLHSIKLRTPKPRYSALTATTPRDSLLNESYMRDMHGDQVQKLRRSELMDLSITLEPGEISRLCQDTNATSAIVNQSLLLKAEDRVDSLENQFLSTIQALGSTQNVFEAVSSFIETCTNSLNNFTKLKGISEEISWLINERDTWRLINALYKDRSIKYDEFLEDNMMVDYIPERSERDIQEYFYKSNRSVREAQIVVDWLERIARDECKLLERTEIGYYTDRTVAWENTLHTLQTGGAVAYRPTRDIVTQLDPDAPYRLAMPLHDIDYEDDKRLLRQVFLEIRCGRLNKAQEHCIHCGQYWRADVLEGWRLFHDPNYVPPFSDTKLPPEGNPHRDVWKLCAWRMCSDPKVPQEEKVVMGSLCGHLPSLLAVAENWEDLLWAEMKAYVDIKVEQEIRDNSLRNYVDMPKDYWNGLKSMENVFTNIKTHDKGKLEADRPDRIIQELVINDNIPELLKRCSEWVEGQCDIQFLRFLVHIVLVLRMLGRSEPVYLGDNVLYAYIQTLIGERNTEAIAYYSSLLPEDKQIELYSTFMEQVGESAEKANVLAAAEKYDLNIKAITERVVQSVRSRRREVLDKSFLVKEMTEEDAEKISALDWMVYYKEQRVEAMWECNALIRTFIIDGKLPAARLAFNKIPEDSVILIVTQYNLGVVDDMNVNFEKFPPKVNCTVREFLCYKAYLDAHDGFNHWFHQYHNTKPVEPTRPEGGEFTEIMAYEHKLEKYNEECERWKATMEHITKNVKTQLHNILVFPDKGWLVDDYKEDPVRRRTLKRLRAHCIPQIFVLLHKVLLSMELHEEAMDLVGLLVDEKYKFYKIFSKAGLLDMLDKVVETSLALMTKCDNAFIEVTESEREEKEKPPPLTSFVKPPSPLPIPEGEQAPCVLVPPATKPSFGEYFQLPGYPPFIPTSEEVLQVNEDEEDDEVVPAEDDDDYFEDDEDEDDDLSDSDIFGPSDKSLDKSNEKSHDYSVDESQEES